MNICIKVALMTISAVLAACQTNSQLYYWGSYEEQLYNQFNKPGKAPPELQIDKLSEDIERAENSGKKIAPGVHAHLGLMYAAVGNMAAAEAAFNNEKKLYPESAVLLDGMLQRAYDASQKQRGSL